MAYSIHITITALREIDQALGWYAKQWSAASRGTSD